MNCNNDSETTESNLMLLHGWIVFSGCHSCEGDYLKNAFKEFL